MHSGPFGCLTKLGAKHAELVQKLVPRSHIRIFLNERSRSNPLDPKLMFWCVLYHLGAFGTVWLPYETRWKTGRTSAKGISRNRVAIFPNERTRSTPLDPKLTFCCIFHTIWVHSGSFGCLMKLGAKRAELVQIFVPRIRVRIFRNERTRSTPFDYKTIF